MTTKLCNFRLEEDLIEELNKITDNKTKFVSDAIRNAIDNITKTDEKTKHIIININL